MTFIELAKTNYKLTKYQAQMVANEVRSLGFNASITKDSAVIISLNRPLCIMEVEIPLLDIFEVNFNYSKVSDNQVKVTL